MRRIRPVDQALMDKETPVTTVLRDLNKLNTFVRVAQWQSFTKAAAELRTMPSVVSKRMKELEESLGFSVLTRSTHGLALTEAGRGLFQQCLEILAKLDNFVTERRNIETGPFGTLRIQATSDYSRWIRFAVEVLGVGEPPKSAVGVDDADEVADWVASAVAAFSRKHGLLGKFEAFMAEGTP